jgi:hypothetical protein
MKWKYFEEQRICTKLLKYCLEYVGNGSPTSGLLDSLAVPCFAKRSTIAYEYFPHPETVETGVLKNLSLTGLAKLSRLRLYS